MSDYLDRLEEHRTDDSLIAAERSVVGAMLLDGRRVPDVKALIRPTDFYDIRYEAICETAFEMYQKGRPVDVISVGTRMRVKGRFRGFSEALLHELTSEVPTAANAAYYAEIVAGGATRRRLRAAGLKLIAAADDPSVEVLAAVEDGRTLLDDALPGELEQKYIGEYVDDFMRDLADETVDVVRTPYPDLDALIQGWKPGRLVVIGARPAVGKSVVGVQCAAVAAQYGDVLLFTGEMDRGEVMGRLYASIGGIPLGVIERKNIGNFQARFDQTRAVVDQLGLVVNDTASSWDEIELATWDLHRRGKLKMIVVDYLGLYRNGSGSYESRQAEIELMTRRAKQLAKRLGITVVLLQQLNRDADRGGEEKAPTMTHLRGSGSFEQDADIVILLHQGSKKNPVTKQHERDGTLWLYVTKQRNGPTGNIELYFEGAYARATHKTHAR